MALFEWSNDYSVGIAEIDAQHQRLVAMLNQLSDAMRSGKGSQVLDRVLGDLVAYTGTHFATEERLMQANGYPDFPRHKREHDQLTAQVLDLQQSLRAGSAVLSVDLLHFLKDWLTQHILGSDKRYGPFLQGRGVH
jgi:hemerythrin